MNTFWCDLTVTSASIILLLPSSIHTRLIRSLHTARSADHFNIVTKLNILRKLSSGKQYRFIIQTRNFWGDPTIISAITKSPTSITTRFARSSAPRSINRFNIKTIQLTAAGSGTSITLSSNNKR